MRMGSETPKQFMLLAGKPVLMHTLERFKQYDPTINLVVVLPAPLFGEWNALCKQHGFTTKHQLCDGGPERFHSVKNGLTKVGDGVVGIHDGVRPLVSAETLDQCYKKAEISGNAIPVIEVKESVRRRIDGGNKYIKREGLCVVQTPQCFQVPLIKKAYNVPYNERFTDDASVLEATGHNINLVDGNCENIKITTPTDLKIAEALLA